MTNHVLVSTTVLMVVGGCGVSDVINFPLDSVIIMRVSTLHYVLAAAREKRFLEEEGDISLTPSSTATTTTRRTTDCVN